MQVYALIINNNTSRKQSHIFVYKLKILLHICSKYCAIKPGSEENTVVANSFNIFCGAHVACGNQAAYYVAAERCELKRINNIETKTKSCVKQ